jgi:ABC-2 type transport system ATP-binding protein
VWRLAISLIRWRSGLPSVGVMDTNAPRRPPVMISGLTKRYGSRTAVDGLDIEVPRGSVAGFVGPNGAGKTTTLRVMLGLVRPSAGQGQILGEPLTEPERYLTRVGALIDSPAFYPGLSGERNLAALATLSGSGRGQIPALLRQVGLVGRGGDPYRTYSLGMRQRLGIAAALLGDPELLLLDEPANGLDPAGIKEMRALLRSLADGHRTILVSSHLLAEVQQVCDWLIVIDHGSRIYQGPTAELLAMSGDELVLGSEHPADLPRLQALLTRRGLPSARFGDRLRVSLGDLLAAGDETGAAKLLADINRAAAADGLALAELAIEHRNLEESFLDLLGGTR